MRVSVCSLGVYLASAVPLCGLFLCVYAGCVCVLRVPLCISVYVYLIASVCMCFVCVCGWWCPVVCISVCVLYRCLQAVSVCLRYMCGFAQIHAGVCGGMVLSVSLCESLYFCVVLCCVCVSTLCGCLWFVYVVTVGLWCACVTLHVKVLQHFMSLCPHCWGPLNPTSLTPMSHSGPTPVLQNSYFPTALGACKRL